MNGAVNKTKITQVVISIQDSIQTCQTLLSFYIYIFKIKYKTLKMDRTITELWTRSYGMLLSRLF